MPSVAWSSRQNATRELNRAAVRVRGEGICLVPPPGFTEQTAALQARKDQHHMAATPTSRPILHAIAPRFPVGNAEQTLAFYERIGFACTHQEEGFMIVERDGVQLHLHPSNEPPTRHGAFWIRVSNIEALYQEYLAANVVTSSQVRTKPWGFKEFHICDPFRNIFIFAGSLPEGSAEQAS